MNNDVWKSFPRKIYRDIDDQYAIKNIAGTHPPYFTYVKWGDISPLLFQKRNFLIVIIELLVDAEMYSVAWL